MFWLIYISNYLLSLNQVLYQDAESYNVFLKIQFIKKKGIKIPTRNVKLINYPFNSGCLFIFIFYFKDYAIICVSHDSTAIIL